HGGGAAPKAEAETVRDEATCSPSAPSRASTSAPQKSDKSKNAKVAFVGVLYTLRKTRRCGLKAPAPRGLVLLRASRVESRGPFPLWLPSTGGALRAPSVGPAHGEG